MLTRLSSLSVLLLLATACGKKESPPATDVPTATPATAAPTPQPTHDDELAPPDEPTDEPADEPTDEPADEPAEDPGEAAAPQPAGAAKIMDPSRCAPLVARELALIRASGTDEMRDAVSAKTDAEHVASCASAPVPESYEQCVARIGSALEIFRDCVAQVFAGRDLTVGRTFNALEDNSAVEPEVFELDGDMLTFGRCSMLHQKIGNFRGFFLDCPGQPTLGPLTTSEDIRATMAALSQESASAHSTVLGIMNNYPRGGGTWRVCQNGQCRTE